MKVLCFGDSNTYGFDPRSFFGERYDSKNRWTDLLAHKTGWEIINAGLCGRSVPHDISAARLVQQYAPVDILIIMLGTNDLLQGLSAKDTAAKMEAFLTPFPPQCNYIILTVPQMNRGEWVQSEQLINEAAVLASKYQALAQKLHILFADTRSLNLTLTFDGVHFTEADHHRFADFLSQTLQNKKKLS